MTPATSARSMYGTDRSCRGEKQMTLQMPFSDLARNSVSSPVDISGVSGSRAEKSLVKTKVPV